MCELNNLVRLMCVMALLVGDNAEETDIERNGTAKLGTLPFRVDFRCRSQIPTEYESLCGGALIGANKVLTLPQCVIIEGKNCGRSFKEGDKYIATVGHYVVAGGLKQRIAFTEPGTQWRKIKSVTLPKNYNAEKTNIAVVYTVTKFRLNKNVAVLPYASIKKDYAAVGADCMISGYVLRPSPLEHQPMSNDLMFENITILNDTLHSDGLKFIITETPDVWKDIGGALICWNTTDPAQGKNGLIVGVNVNEGYCYASVVDHNADYSKVDTKPHCGPKFARVSSFYDFITNKSTNTKGNLCLYCFIFMLCQKCMAMM